MEGLASVVLLHHAGRGSALDDIRIRLRWRAKGLRKKRSSTHNKKHLMTSYDKCLGYSRSLSNLLADKKHSGHAHSYMSLQQLKI